MRAGTCPALAAGLAHRSEGKNLAKDKPVKVRELAALWTKQFEEYCALATKDLPPARPEPGK